MKRRTRADRQRERMQADRRAWEHFKAKLEAAQTLEDASRVAISAPPESAPGRKYYTNLHFFLTNDLFVPGGATRTECEMYRSLLRRWVDNGFELRLVEQALEQLRLAIADDTRKL